MTYSSQPKYPFRVTVVSDAPGNSLRVQTHNFEDIATAVDFQVVTMRKPTTKQTTLAVVICELNRENGG